MKLRIATAALALGLASCQSTMVRVDYDTSFDFRTLATFAWIPESDRKPIDPRLDNPLTDTRIREAVETELATKGFQKVDVTKADFWIGYVTYVRERVEVVNVGIYSRPDGNEWGPEIVRWYRYDCGTLILDFVQPKTNALLWRGVVEGKIGDWTPEEKRRRIQNAVRQVLEEFPDRAGGPDGTSRPRTPPERPKTDVDTAPTVAHGRQE